MGETVTSTLVTVIRDLYHAKYKSYYIYEDLQITHLSIVTFQKF